MLEELKQDLENATGISFALFSWSTQPEGDYGVVGITGTEDAVIADSQLEHFAAEGYVDVVVNGAGEDTMKQVQSVLNTYDLIASNLDGVWFDKDIGRTHYIWRIGMVMK